jgi:AcrR family transcriptional regulator
MSPYPVQTDPETIVETARRLIERDGVEDLSLARLAAQLGIKAPSLYRYFKSKTDLLQTVIEHTYRRQFQAYQEALIGKPEDPVERLKALFHAHRTFARQPAYLYLAYTTTDPELRTDLVTWKVRR